jgi:hypothetical protein
MAEGSIASQKENAYSRPNQHNPQHIDFEPQRHERQKHEEHRPGGP